MAAESAIILARLLGEHEPSDELFKRYASIRHPRTDFVTANSRRAVNAFFVSLKGGWKIIWEYAVWLLGGTFFRSGMMGQFAYDAGAAAL